MFDPGALSSLRQVISACAKNDKRLLDELCRDVRSLAREVRTIKPRSVTSIALVASDGGNNQLVFDPFHLQVIRVVDSYGKQLCLDAVSPTTDTDGLSRMQFWENGQPRTALGQLMSDLDVRPRTLHALSHMIPDGKTMRENPESVSPSWVTVYRDLYEWATLYERICHRSFASDTLIVRDGLLRSKIFRGDFFIRYRQKLDDAIRSTLEQDRRQVYLVGIAKHSRVLERYTLAMAIENIFPAGEPLYVRIPREMEKKAYVWPEYARGAEVEGTEGEAPKFVAGDMYFVRFGRQSGDPIWTIDILSSQSDRSAEVFGYLLQDAIEGFPVPFYPRCLQKAHEYAEIVDFDLDILQDEVFNSIREILPNEKRLLVEAMRLKADVTERRYQ